jgi:hypothetical protein
VLVNLILPFFISASLMSSHFFSPFRCGLAARFAAMTFKPILYSLNFFAVSFQFLDAGAANSGELKIVSGRIACSSIVIKVKGKQHCARVSRRREAWNWLRGKLSSRTHGVIASKSFLSEPYAP